ncbi:MAG: hypothetical protein N3D73_02535 [Candidatus Diapherotrites archaeon]|nr:hypothetical protein [Candidatus Diapherotrites archaeon]
MSLKNKIKNIRYKDKELYEIAKRGIKKGLSKYSKDRLLFVLVVVDVILIVMIILALIFLFDPNEDFFDMLAEKTGIKFDSYAIPWELKLALFLLTIFLTWKLYSYTEWYRKRIKHIYS